MNNKKQNQKSATSQPPNHDGSLITRDAVVPVVRLYDILDDDLIWFLGEERDEEFVYPFARVPGRRTASLVADLFRLRECFKPIAT